METKQVRFVDCNGDSHEGIMLDFGGHAQVICGCCGAIFDVLSDGLIPSQMEDNECYIIKKHDFWVDFSSYIR